MRKITFLLLGTALIASTAWAGGSIFKHKRKSSNPYGVYAINTHVCSNLECPSIRIVEGKCDGEHMSKHWGVCVCEAGYVAEGTNCVACPDGQYSDGINGCTGCAPGMYKANENDTKCTECPNGYYCPNGVAIECPQNATCDATGFSCDESFTTTTTGCECGAGKYVDSNQKCMPCPDGYYCPNGVAIECPEHATTCDATGFTCDEDFEKGTDSCVCNGYYKDGENGCWHCDDPYEVGPTTEADCNSCNRLWQDQTCYPKCTDGFYANGECVPCSADGGYYTGKIACDQCSNREIEDGSDFGYCVKKCDDGFRDSDWNCHSCSEFGIFHTNDEERCTTKCPNRVSEGSICILCSDLTKPEDITCIPSYTLSPENMTYDQAVAWCAARGQRFATWDGLGCEKYDDESGFCPANLEELYYTPYWITTNFGDTWVVGGGGSAWPSLGPNAHALCVGEPTTPPEPTCSINPETDCLSKALVDGQCACAPAEDGATCTSWTNNECGQGKYCAFDTSEGCGENGPDNPGTCQSVDYIGNHKTAIINDHEYTATYCDNCPDLWSAQSWCKAFDKTMVSLEDLHCPGSDCSTFAKNLGNIFYKTPVWTTDPSGIAGGEFLVNLQNGNVFDDGRCNNSDYDVLCR